MLLIYTQKVTPRLDYVFKHICTRILGVKVEFTSVIETFISHQGPKLSYGKQPLGNELYIQAFGLLTSQGFEDLDIKVSPWQNTIGFFLVGEKSALPFDIFSSSFYLLSRYEEYLPHVKDSFGRYPASESMAHKENFLLQPVVDIWAYKFKDVLLQQFPDMVFTLSTFKKHSLVEASQPFAHIQRGFLRNLIDYGSDVLKFKARSIVNRTKVLLKLREDPYYTFPWMIENSKERQVTMFFLLGEGYRFREDLNTFRKKFKSLVKYASDYVEVGLLFSFHSLDDYERLKNEKEQMEGLTHRSLSSSMIDYFFVDLPGTYRDLLELELQKDYSMFYANHIGFRAGTCTPFLFYDLDYEIKTPLLLHPVIGRTFAFKNKTEEEIISIYNNVQDSVRKVNGTFSLLFSNIDFTNKKMSDTFKKLFSEN